MEDRVKVSTTDLKKIAVNITEKQRRMMDIFNTSIKDIIIGSREAITKSGLSYEDIEKEFNNTYMKFSKAIEELVNTLNRKIIPKYENVSDDIRYLFNNQFAGQLSQLLDLHERRDK